MELEIDRGLLDNTGCEKDFACLSGDKKALFGVIKNPGHSMVEIDGLTPINLAF